MESKHNFEGMALKDALVCWHEAVDIVVLDTDKTIKGLIPDVSGMKQNLARVEYWRAACETLSISEHTPITDVDFLESSRPDIQ